MPKVIRKRSLRSACKWWDIFINSDGRREQDKALGVYHRVITYISETSQLDWHTVHAYITSDLDETIKNFEKLGYGVY